MTLSNVVMVDALADAISPLSLTNGQITSSSDIELTIVADGTIYPLAIGNIGQNARLSFEGTAGQVLNFNLDNLVFTPNGAGSLRPNSTT